MPRLVKNGTLSDDAWTFYETPPAGVPDGESIVPFDYWRTHGSAVPWGVWVEGDFEVETLGPAAGDVPLIAVRFAAFSDGRGLSLGSMLRTRYGFTGELALTWTELEAQYKCVEVPSTYGDVAQC